MEFEELRQLMADVFECDPSKITPHTTPNDLEEWDSLRLLNLVLAIEQQAGVELPTDDLERLMSVPAILQLVQDAKAR